MKLLVASTWLVAGGGIGVVGIELAFDHPGSQLQGVAAQRDLERLEVLQRPFADQLLGFLGERRPEFGREPFFSGASIEAALRRSSSVSAHCSEAAHRASMSCRSRCPDSTCCLATASSSAFNHRETVLPPSWRVML
ncbi:MAG: hypothetical protein ABIP94_16430 [Planctomycetota bacterium]